MRGYLLNFSIQVNKDYILNVDGQFYVFASEKWKEDYTSEKGMSVHF